MTDGGDYNLWGYSTGLTWDPGLNAIQFNDFSLTRVFFNGLAEGTTGVTASAWMWDIGFFGPVTTQIDVQIPGPATPWLA